MTNDNERRVTSHERRQGLPVPTSGAVQALHLCVGHRAPMRALSHVRAVADLGLEGDRHGRPGSRRQILMVEWETLEALQLLPGELRENITTTGLLLRVLTRGTRLKVGSEAVLEVTERCDPCSRMEEIRSGLAQTLEGRRGMLARVLRGGDICIGDRIEVQASQNEPL